MTKPATLEAFRALNSIDVHEPFYSVFKLIHTIDSETRLAELQTFATTVSANVRRIKPLEEEINIVFHSHQFYWLHAHLRAAYMYLEEVNKKLNSLSAAIGSANQEQIAAAIGEFKPLKNMATQLNHETEELMQMLGVSDEEANYRYRKF